MVVGALTVDTDVLIIGGGPGGYTAAIRAAQLGKDVTVVETEKRLGGICLTSGCIPTKALIHAANTVYSFKEMAQMGISSPPPAVDFGRMMAWKDGIVERLTSGIKGLFDNYGIEVICGRASFTSPNEAHIEGQSDVTTIRFKYAIIATGSTSFHVPGFPKDDPLVLNHTQILSIDHVPARMLIIGGGYLGCEFSNIFAKLGTQVHIIEMLPRILSGIETSLTAFAMRELKKLGVTIQTGAKAVGYERKDSHAVVKIEREGQIQSLEVDVVLMAASRTPNSKNIGLDAAGVSTDPKGFIPVDVQRRTNVKHIFAIGDVAGSPMLAHKAMREGKVAAEVIAGLPSAFDNKVIPYVIFNHPEIASVGLTEEEAKAKGIEAAVGRFPFGALGRAHTMNSTDGFVKIVHNTKSGKIIGAHMVGPGATDLISEMALAIEMGATLEDIGSTIHPHPTLPEALMEAAEMALGKCTDMYVPKTQEK